MRERRESAWVDPRFAKKKPKKLQLNKFGEAPATLPCKPPPKPAGTCPRPGTAGPSRPSTTQRIVVRPPPLPSGPQVNYPLGPGSVSMAPQESCPRGPPPRPCPQETPRPCPREIPQTRPSGIQRPQGIPRPSGIQRPQGIPRPSGIQRPCPQEPPRPAACPRPGTSGLQQPSFRPSPSGLRAPTVETASSLTARRLGGDPSMASRFVESGTCPRPPQASTPAQRSIVQPGFSSRLQQPSRLMAPGSFLQRRKAQKIVLMPGDIDPQETTVITVEPPAPRSGASTMQDPGSAWTPLPSSVPFDLSPPSMSSFRRNEPMPEPYIPPEVLNMPAAEPPCPEPEMDMAETSHGLLIDVTQPNECYPEGSVNVEPVDLISFPPQDPFSPERPVRPLSPGVSPPPIPFSPPKSPLPEPSELHKWYSQYPQYKEAFQSTYHPILEYNRLKRDRPPPDPRAGRTPAFVDREVLAKSVPHNRHVSTICRDDSDDDLGLLPDLGDELTPCDYAAIQRQEQAAREERMARAREREREEKGPTLCEAREMLARVREREFARRAELEADQMSSYRPPPEPMEQARERYRRVMARAGQVDNLPSWGGGPATSNEPCPGPAADMSMTGNFEMLQDIQMDDMDLDAIDMIDECPLNDTE